MNYKFEVNGDIKLIISPKNNLEETIFAELFSTSVEVVITPNSKEIVIKKKAQDSAVKENF